MSAIHVSAQELSDIYASAYCTYAACAIFVYDWLLCLDQEITFVWSWHTGLNIFSLLYALSRYTFLIQGILAVTSIYPMSDISCKANGWAQNAFGTLGIAAFSAFSALRAYALSDKNIWLTAMIIFLALPAPAIEIFLAVNIEFQTLPSPFNCVGSSKLSPMVYHIVYRIMRVSQLAAELLVVIITWWYTYQSYRIRKGLKIGKTISSLIIYNGSIYFIFFAGWYILDIIIDTASVSPQVVRVDSFLELFYDPIVSPFTCRFMLALRQFDSRTMSAVACPGMGLTTLEFGTQPSDSFPGFIASFSHPLHVDSSLSETDFDGIIPEGRELDARVQ